MPEKNALALTFKSQSMGEVIVQPESTHPELIEKTSLVLFPFRMNDRNRAAAIEWASTSQTPIFCHAQDIPKLVEQGFGSYRFHKLDGFREVDFQGGALDFFPARRPKPTGLHGLATDLLEKMGFLKSKSYHFAIRPKLERPVLFLTGSEFEATEWKVMSREKYEYVFGLDSWYGSTDWNVVEKKLGTKIVVAPRIGVLVSGSFSQTIKPRGLENLAHEGVENSEKNVASL